LHQPEDHDIVVSLIHEHAISHILISFFRKLYGKPQHLFWAHQPSSHPLPPHSSPNFPFPNPSHGLS
jgi:hypothetical protein